MAMLQLQLTLPQPDMVTFWMAEGSSRVSVTLSKPTDFRCAAKPASMLLACPGNHSASASAMRVMHAGDGGGVMGSHGVEGLVNRHRTT